MLDFRYFALARTDFVWCAALWQFNLKFNLKMVDQCVAASSFYSFSSHDLFHLFSSTLCSFLCLIGIYCNCDQIHNTFTNECNLISSYTAGRHCVLIHSNYVVVVVVDIFSLMIRQDAARRDMTRKQTQQQQQHRKRFV